MLTPAPPTNGAALAHGTTFPIVLPPVEDTVALPVLVAIPHFGELALPVFDPTDYTEPEFAHFARGFADPFAADIYGGMHRTGATVIASPFSRLFVDLNRERDDFQCVGEMVESKKGVIRTHTLSGRPVFRRRLTRAAAEARLTRYYDPYHQTLKSLLGRPADAGGPQVLLDAHTALAKRFGDRQIIISTQRGKTARPGLDKVVGDAFAEAGFQVDYDVPGYAGGYTVRRYGRMRDDRIDAVQVEVGLSTLIDIPRMGFIDAVKRGEHPQPCSERLSCLQSSMAEAVIRVAAAVEQTTALANQPRETASG